MHQNEDGLGTSGGGGVSGGKEVADKRRRVVEGERRRSTTKTEEKQRGPEKVCYGGRIHPAAEETQDPRGSSICISRPVKRGGGSGGRTWGPGGVQERRTRCGGGEPVRGGSEWEPVGVHLRGHLDVCDVEEEVRGERRRQHVAREDVLEVPADREEQPVVPQRQRRTVRDGVSRHRSRRQPKPPCVE